MKKLLKVLISIISVVVLVFTLGFNVSASSINSNENSERLNDEIDELFDARDAMMLQYLEARTTSEKEDIIQQIEEVDSELRTLGVRYLSEEEVREFFREHDSSRLGDLRDVTVPYSAYNNWTLAESNYQYSNGSWYHITVLRATPLPNYTYSSKLGYTSQISCSYTNSWTAGSAYMVRGSSRGSESNELQSTQKTIYDAIHSSIPAVTTSTVVKIPQITYYLRGYLDAMFVYVRPMNSPSSDDHLMLAATKANTTLLYTTSTIQYKNSAGTWVTSGSGVSGSLSFTSYYPDYYDSFSCAVGYYILNSSVERIRNVVLLRLIDPNGTIKISKGVLNPHFPDDVE